MKTSASSAIHSIFIVLQVILACVGVCIVAHGTLGAEGRDLLGLQRGTLQEAFVGYAVLGVAFYLAVILVLWKTKKTGKADGTLSAEPPRELGIITPDAGTPVCAKCQASVARDLGCDEKDAATLRPLFCSTCEAWYHPSCLPESKEKKSKNQCPSCGKNLTGVSRYCTTCKNPTPWESNTSWPAIRCYTCKKHMSFAALFDVGGSEMGWLIGTGVVFLILFIVAMVNNASLPIKMTSGFLACLFALPWILMLLAGIVSSMMPMGMSIGNVGDWGGGIMNRLSQDAKEFWRQPRAYRLAKVYLWVAVNAISAVIILAVGLGVIYFFTNMARQTKH